MRIFRIQLSLASSSVLTLASSTLTPFPTFCGCLCASKSSRIESSVVSKPRFPRNNVGAGGCFCTRKIFCWVFVKLPVNLPVTGSLELSDVPSPPLGVGRPAKSPPMYPQCKLNVRREGRSSYVPSLISKLRPWSSRSERAIAVTFASDVAKST